MRDDIDKAKEIATGSKHKAQKWVFNDLVALECAFQLVTTMRLQQ
jgi:hypothetical protein